MPADLKSLWVSQRRRLRRVFQFYFDHIALPIGTMIVGVASIVLVENVATSRLNPTSGEKEFYGWGLAALVIAVLVAVLGFVLLLMSVQARHGETRAERVQRLTKALEEAMHAIAEISTEMEDGAMRLEELERQTSVQRELAKLTEPEAEAIREALKEELGHERRRSLLRDLGMVLLGAALSCILTRFF